MIAKTPGICGGVACFYNTRIPVWLIVFYIKQGTPTAEIFYNYPSLPTEAIAEAEKYYVDNVAEINNEIREHFQDELQ